MSKPKAATRKAAGKVKELAAEMVGDGRLREDAKAQQRRAEAERDEPADDLNPLAKLDQLT